MRDATVTVDQSLDPDQAAPPDATPDSQPDTAFEPDPDGKVVDARSAPDGAPDAGADAEPIDPADAAPRRDGGEPRCTPGETRGCYDGPAGTAGVGVCAAGTQTCGLVDWTPCADAVLPAAETCDGRDEDCDGAVDEGVDGQPCELAVDGCVIQGVARCADGRVRCEAAAPEPGAEVCNGMDDDCDGTVDEVVAAPCEVGLGVCAAVGQTTCVGGVVGCDAAPGEPADEACNGLDDDCDGLPDEVEPRGCVAGVEPCVADGVERCEGGAWVCDAVAPGPEDELCNGADDDCDGTVDEVAPRDCAAEADGCVGQGTETCQAGEWVCDAVAPAPQPEACNGADDDCDGVVDELEPRGCRAGVGACAVDGVERCVDGGWVCDAAPVEPVAELCNGGDDDCDDVVDEGIVGAACGAGVGACRREANEVCEGGAMVCPAEPGVPASETCDAVDQDCDGVVDEDPSDAGQACAEGVGACRGEGTTACVDGAVVCDAAPLPPGNEVCNAVDDDCDGQIDEGPPGCEFPNGVPACVAGSCVLSRCVDGFFDLDAQPANGCEAGCEFGVQTNLGQLGGSIPAVAIDDAGQPAVVFNHQGAVRLAMPGTPRPNRDLDGASQFRPAIRWTEDYWVVAGASQNGVTVNWVPTGLGQIRTDFANGFIQGEPALGHFEDQVVLGWGGFRAGFSGFQVSIRRPGQVVRQVSLFANNITDDVRPAVALDDDEVHAFWVTGLVGGAATLATWNRNSGLLIRDEAVPLAGGIVQRTLSWLPDPGGRFPTFWDENDRGLTRSEYQRGFRVPISIRRQIQAAVATQVGGREMAVVLTTQGLAEVLVAGQTLRLDQQARVVFRAQLILDSVDLAANANGDVALVGVDRGDRVWLWRGRCQ